MAESRDDSNGCADIGDISFSDLSDEADGDVFSDGYYSPLASDEDTLSDNDSDTNEQLTADLADWAADSQIPHSKLKGLLCFAPLSSPFTQRSHNTPPDYVPLLTIYQMLVVENTITLVLLVVLTSWYSFKELTETFRGYISRSTLIDGLPLYRSSKTQFWPILGRVVSP